MTNDEKRKELYRQLEEIREAHKREIDRICEIEDEEEEEREYEQECTRYESAFKPTYREWFYLQFPARRGWFSDTFIASFGTCEGKKLSLKQTDVVRRYVVASADSWKTQEYYCRTANNLKVKLFLPKYGNGIGYLTVSE